ncbi:hypothetical protein [Deinococcus cellulosilyticus]|uniref:Uncharacterized protein n=1 Tax=Deinococcus cellulosilyticus (strain DSM 18568 / NBRC 106333 / KACC 11606 / 5516J-15) TaxID=1223518 RepID=A0A511N2W5_DEIC1|nr:hypothetical protein [Deinococcus cellulosilyticus]GEM47189.1 hypothetical protein DC3_28240 [Deinococcus cellulosilyticus NBRC 106333 = KACC 11606]
MQTLKQSLQQVTRTLRIQKPQAPLPQVVGQPLTECPHCGAPRVTIEVEGVGSFQILQDACCNPRAFEVVQGKLQTAFDILTSVEDQNTLIEHARGLMEHLTPEQRTQVNEHLIPTLEAQLRTAEERQKQQPNARGPRSGEVAG